MAFKIVCLLCLFVVACSQETIVTPQKPISSVLKDQTANLMSLPGVVGTGEGRCEGTPCIKVYVKKKSPETLKQIPTGIEGYPVTIEETGEIRPLSSH